MTVSQRPGARQARELAKRLGWLTEAQAAAGWAVIIILAALLGAIYLNQASRIAAIGRQVQIEQITLKRVKLQNASLEQLIAEAQSLERLNAEAISLGYVPARPEDINYIVIPDYPAYDLSAPAVVKRDAQQAEAALAPESMLEAIVIMLETVTSKLFVGEAYE